MDSTFYKQLEQSAYTFVQEAGQILIDGEKNFTIDHRKDEFDLATSVDIEVEKFLRKKISDMYPSHGIMGEELDTTNGLAEYVWVLDPLDCTKEYVKGVGEYNCLAAVERNGSLVAGVIRRFGHNMTYTCSKGNGSYKDQQQIHVSTVSDLSLSFIGMNIPNRKRCTDEEIDRELAVLGTFAKVAYRVRPGWDDAKLFAWVAQGAMEACVSFPNNNKWVDVAPALLLVEEAGGKLSDWFGNPLQNHDLSKGIVVSNGILHDTIISIIQKNYAYAHT